MKTFLFLSLLTVLSFRLSAQTTLNSSCNLPRSEDRLVKQQVEYKAPGNAGTQVIWDFSEQNPINEHYELRYNALNSESDTLVGIEHRTMYYYRLQGDSLLSLGYENPTTLVNNRKAETLLVFPFVYGRTLTDYFDGTGNYCSRLDIHVQGKSTVTADATGVLLLPGGDTLQHVLRVHTQKQMVERMTPVPASASLRTDTLPFILNRDSIDWYLSTDSSSLQLDTWRWYAEGYRYPVFESIEGSICRPGQTKVPYFATSFYYPPHEQYYALDEDSENQAKRDELSEKAYSIPGEDNASDGKHYSDDKLSYNLSIDSDGTLTIGYALHEAGDIRIGLFDLQGRQLSNLRHLQSPEGSYSETLSLSDFPSGEYLLHLTVSGKTYGEKVLKR